MAIILYVAAGLIAGGAAGYIWRNSLAAKNLGKAQEKAKKRLEEAELEAKNIVIMSHKSNLQDAAGKEFGDLGEGEVVVFKPLGNSKFKVVARVAPPETWSKWAK